MNDGFNQGSAGMIGQLSYREATPLRKPEAIRVYADGRVEGVEKFAGGLYDVVEEKCATCGKVERRRKFRVHWATAEQVADPDRPRAGGTFVLIEEPENRSL